MSKKSGNLPILGGLWVKNDHLGCVSTPARLLSETEVPVLSESEAKEREKECAQLAGFLKELGYE